MTGVHPSSSPAVPADELARVVVEHCEQRMTLKSTQIGYEGEHELIATRFACPVCDSTVVMDARLHVGPPG